MYILLIIYLIVKSFCLIINILDHYRGFLKNLKDSYRRGKINYYSRSMITISWNGKIFV